MKYIKGFLPALLMVTLVMSMASCATPSSGLPGDLMGGVSPHYVYDKPADANFISSTAEFSIELFKKSMASDKNSLISPLSMILALAMAANGAYGETLTQMETLLGGDIPLATLNQYLYSYVKSLPSEEKSKLNIANAIWIRDTEDLYVEPKFLQANADYYNAAARKSAFDDQTIEDINNWVKQNTDGMIDSILNEIRQEHMLFLLNAITFDAEWEQMYIETAVEEGDFTDINGEVQSVDFMNSSEYTYLNSTMATGFVKPYVNGGYSFAAFLPREGVPIESFIESLTGTAFIEMIEDAKGNDVKISASIPKFEFAYEIQMNDPLKALGMTDAFDKDIADFSRMGTIPGANLFVGEVLHKTFIAVNERGTRAGAVTVEKIEADSVSEAEVILNRPFVFSIIDNSTNLPLFIGTVVTT